MIWSAVVFLAGFAALLVFVVLLGNWLRKREERDTRISRDQAPVRENVAQLPMTDERQYGRIDAGDYFTPALLSLAVEANVDIDRIWPHRDQLRVAQETGDLRGTAAGPHSLARIRPGCAWWPRLPARCCAGWTCRSEPRN